MFNLYCVYAHQVGSITMLAVMSFVTFGNFLRASRYIADILLNI